MPAIITDGWGNFVKIPAVDANPNYGYTSTQEERNEAYKAISTRGAVYKFSHNVWNDLVAAIHNCKRAWTYEREDWYGDLSYYDTLMSVNKIIHDRDLRYPFASRYRQSRAYSSTGDPVRIRIAKTEIGNYQEGYFTETYLEAAKGNPKQIKFNEVGFKYTPIYETVEDEDGERHEEYVRTERTEINKTTTENLTDIVGGYYTYAGDGYVYVYSRGESNIYLADDKGEYAYINDKYMLASMFNSAVQNIPLQEYYPTKWKERLNRDFVQTRDICCGDYFNDLANLVWYAYTRELLFAECTQDITVDIDFIIRLCIALHIISTMIMNMKIAANVANDLSARLICEIMRLRLGMELNLLLPDANPIQCPMFIIFEGKMTIRRTVLVPFLINTELFKLRQECIFKIKKSVNAKPDELNIVACIIPKIDCSLTTAAFRGTMLFPEPDMKCDIFVLNDTNTWFIAVNMPITEKTAMWVREGYADAFSVKHEQKVSISATLSAIIQLFLASVLKETLNIDVDVNTGKAKRAKSEMHINTDISAVFSTNELLSFDGALSGYVTIIPNIGMSVSEAAKVKQDITVGIQATISSNEVIYIKIDRCFYMNASAVVQVGIILELALRLDIEAEMSADWHTDEAKHIKINTTLFKLGGSSTLALAASMLMRGEIKYSFTEKCELHLARFTYAYEIAPYSAKTLDDRFVEDIEYTIIK